MQQLTPLAGAGVPPGLSRLRSTNKSHRLRTDVLHFESALVKLCASEQVLAALIFQDVVQRTFAVRPAMSQPGCESFALTRTGAQPQHGLRLQGSHPLRSDLDLFFCPTGDGSRKEFAFGETLWAVF